MGMSLADAHPSGMAGMHLPLLSSLGNSPDRFAALTTLHGSLMVFLVLTAPPGRLRKLFSAAADRRARNGFPR